MGRTFENRKHAMAKRGARDARAFTKAGRQLALAVKSGGPEPDGNPALRRAIQNARAVNMPKDRIQTAIQKASGAGSTESYEEIMYEGYGPHGVALIVETLTDNPTRTVANVRTAFNKNGGNMGNTGSVSFLFDRFAVFHLKPDGLDREELELELIDHGLEDLLDGQDQDGKATLVIRCGKEAFGTLQSALEERKIEPVSSGLEWIPKTEVSLTDDQAEEVVGLMDRLEQDDDVQKVFANVE